MIIPDADAARAAHALGLLVARRRLAQQVVDPALVELHNLLERNLSRPADEVISTADAAAILHMSPRRVRELCDSLGGVRLTGRALYFPRAAVEEYARNMPPRQYRKSPT